MTDLERYRHFMCSPANIGNCAECPENRDCSNWGGNRPCGQQHCWVALHCKDDAAED